MNRFSTITLVALKDKMVSGLEWILHWNSDAIWTSNYLLHQGLWYVFFCNARCVSPSSLALHFIDGWRIISDFWTCIWWNWREVFWRKFCCICLDTQSISFILWNLFWAFKVTDRSFWSTFGASQNGGFRI